MSKRIVLMSVMLTTLVILAGTSAGASDMSDLNAFLYEGLSYLPLNSTASLLGAQLRWDAAQGQAIITYNGEDLVLTPNSLKALYGGQPIVLPSPPVVVNGVTYVPLDTFKKYYNVPVEWDGARSTVRIKGRDGWSTVKASSRAPWHGGPPPWAPAWGQRGHGTPGRSINVKANGNEKAKGNRPAVVRRGHDAPGHSINGKANGNGKGKAKAKGNKKDR